VHALADTRGVDEAPDSAADLDERVDGVTGGAGEVVDDDALLPRGLVEQARLADVRAADDRNATGPTDLLLRDLRHLGQDAHGLIEHVGDAATVQRRDRPGLAEAEAP